MIQKIKAYLNTHEKMYELLRYLIAGGLTTLLSMVIHYAGCFFMADKVPFAAYEGSWIAWLIDSINRANNMQMSIASAISWIIAVLFAFWINRGMVFRVDGGTRGKILGELVQFAGSRLVSFLVFEQGLMLLLKLIGVSNFVNRIIVLIFVMVFNYVVSKFWIFKAPSGEKDDKAQ